MGRCLRNCFLQAPNFRLLDAATVLYCSPSTKTASSSATILSPVDLLLTNISDLNIVGWADSHYVRLRGVSDHLQAKGAFVSAQTSYDWFKAKRICAICLVHFVVGSSMVRELPALQRFPDALPDVFAAQGSILGTHLPTVPSRVIGLALYASNYSAQYTK
ncbi:hypothetical protein N7520_004621 [Penicillium odoratum]|uniref:uncharacterized protein n=1 Tax=Penicillium odoratum TaxID=1167516 RepID=UPI002548645B|nr:uncharacterized protein N7520_004621 [Penicillium odoratum]KAJ5765062.1 hypothetical protein N7520_004621 [Penicillium odoratum]